MEKKVIFKFFDLTEQDCARSRYQVVIFEPPPENIENLSPDQEFYTYDIDPSILFNYPKNGLKRFAEEILNQLKCEWYSPDQGDIDRLNTILSEKRESIIKSRKP